MDLFELREFFAAQTLGTARRTLRLAWSEALQERFGRGLLPQRAILTEGVCEPTEARIDCLALSPRLPLNELPGELFALQMLTDRGELRSFPLVLTEARLGPSDGGLTAVHLVGCDVMSLMHERRQLRCFHDRNVPAVVNEVLDGWLGNGLHTHFSVRWLADRNLHRHPARSCFIQHPDESDAGFVQRLLRGAGIGWFWRPQPPREGERWPVRLPRQELVLFDDGTHLPPGAPEGLPWHRRDTSLPVDSIDLLTPRWRLAPCGVGLRSWDHEAGELQRCHAVAGAARGGLLAPGLGPVRVAAPHLGDDLDHAERLARAHDAHQRQRAQVLTGRGGVRTLAPGHRQRIDGCPAFEGLDERARSFNTVRVEHVVFNNLPAELDAPALALLGDGGLPGWAHDGAGPAGPKPAQRYVNRFEAVPVASPLVPPPLAEHEQPRLRTLTGIVVAPQGMNLQTDELGRSRVQLLGGEPGADTTAWVRHRTPWAGNGIGLSTVLRPGTEVDVEWLAYDRPVIAGCHFHRWQGEPPRPGHQPGLPFNGAQTALVGQELGSRRQQHLLLDDHPDQPMAQLASDAGHSALSLGVLTTPRREGRAKARGDGFELRSDAGGALRTAKALLLSAWARLEAAGSQLSAEEHVALMHDALELFKSLGRYGAEHEGLPVDEHGQVKLHADVKATEGGSSVDPRGEGGAPTLSLTAPAGIAATTPQTILSCAGRNIDQVAQQHLQMTAGQRLNANAGQGIGLFAHQGGVSAIAHHGDARLQAQHTDVRVDAGRDVLATAQRRVVFTAGEELLFVLTDGTALRLSKAGIELLSQQPLQVRTNGTSWDGPDSIAAALPSFDAGATSLRFVLRVGGPEGPVAADRPYEITLSDGSTRRGRSDAQGRTELLEHEAMQVAGIRVLNEGEGA